MAQKTVVTLYDDYEAKQGNGDVEADETVEFGLDGKSYEIDLSAPNASQLRSALEDYVAAARPKSTRGRKAASTGTASTPKTSSGSGSDERAANQQKRAFWRIVAGQNPSAVPKFAERGRIPDTVTELYNRSSGSTPEEKAASVPAGATGAVANAPLDPAPSADSTDNGVTDASVAQDPTPTQVDGEVDQTGERLPAGWSRDDNGDLRDEAGYFADDDQLAEALEA